MMLGLPAWDQIGWSQQDDNEKPIACLQLKTKFILGMPIWCLPGFGPLQCETALLQMT